MQAQLNLVQLLDHAFRAARGAASSQPQALLSATLLLVQAVPSHPPLIVHASAHRCIWVHARHASMGFRDTGAYAGAYCPAFVVPNELRSVQEMQVMSRTSQASCCGCSVR